MASNRRVGMECASARRLVSIGRDRTAYLSRPIDIHSTSIHPNILPLHPLSIYLPTPAVLLLFLISFSPSPRILSHHRNDWRHIAVAPDGHLSSPPPTDHPLSQTANSKLKPIPPRPVKPPVTANDYSK